MKFKIAERVSHEYLGDGEVVEVITSFLQPKHAAGYVVKFDHCPPVEYNMGQNPCLVFPSSLILQEQTRNE